MDLTRMTFIIVAGFAGLIILWVLGWAIVGFFMRNSD